MTKFRWFYDTDKETEWLNRMAGQGWAMTGFFLGFYRFEKCEPGEYVYQIDETEKFFGVSEDYRQFMEEMGAEIVCAWGLFAFLRRKAEKGPFQLYTDVESTIAHDTKILNRFETAEAMEAGAIVSCIYSMVQQKYFFGLALACVLAAGLLFLVFHRQTARLRKKLKELKSRQEETGIQAEGKGRPNGLVKGAVIVAGMLGAIVSYTVLHELGHCIAVWLCGGTVTGFYPFGTADRVGPHMTYEGIPDGFSDGLVHIFGSVLPLAAVVLLLLFWKGSKKRPLLNTCVGIISGTFLASVFSWIVEPVGYLVNRFDYSSDVCKFIDTTGLHPAVVMLCALFVFGLICFLFIKRRSRLSLGFMNRKVAVRFLTFLVTIIFMVTLLAYFGSFGAETILAEGNIEYSVLEDQNSILQEEYEILVTEPGEYIGYAEWKVDREGAVAGMVLRRGDEIYPLSCTANWVQAEFLPFYLDSGSYTLSFYLLTCWEDWLEFCEITEAEVSDLSDYVWDPDAPAAVSGKYRFMKKQQAGP